MKITLLNAGRFVGQDDVQFPQEVEAFYMPQFVDILFVSGAEMHRIGSAEDQFEADHLYGCQLGPQVEDTDELLEILHLQRGPAPDAE